MSIHLGAKEGEIAQKVLLPGDPLRAKWIAENFLEDATCYSEVRGMLGYTGLYKGERISVQGTGMGLPSHMIYVNELIEFFGCKSLVRVGSCGSYQKEVKIRDIVLAQAASCESNILQRAFSGMTYAPTADFNLLHKAYLACAEMGVKVHVGNILSADVFYNESPEEWQQWARCGVLAVEMETAVLYYLASKKGVKAMSVLTVSDSLVTKEATTSEERQESFSQMVEISLKML